MTARGIRNNNPGNIRRGDSWQGLAEPEHMTPEQAAEREFCVFRSPEWGIRAMVRILQTYKNKHGVSTIRGAIFRWAPPSENDTETYLQHVARACSAKPDDAIDLSDRKILRPLIGAIILHENGAQPYGDGTIEAGISLALLPNAKQKPSPANQQRSSPAQSKTIQSSVLQIASTLGAGGTAILNLQGTALYVVVGCLTVIALASLIIFRERLLKWADGVR